MSYIRHHAIVVTGQGVEIVEAHKTACGIFKFVSPLLDSYTNGYQSFFIPPDGSKEHWGESVNGNQRRELFINAIEKYRYDDKSHPLNVVEVHYDDEGSSGVDYYSKSMPCVG